MAISVAFYFSNWLQRKKKICATASSNAGYRPPASDFSCFGINITVFHSCIYLTFQSIQFSIICGSKR